MIPQVLFMLIHCIGTNGDVVPNRRQWSELMGIRMPGKNMNATDIIMKALVSAVDVILNLKCRDPTEQQCEHMQQVM